MKSWKTTVAGICTILATVATLVKAIVDGDPTTNPDWGVAIAAITTAFGLIFARDNNVTSETAGAK